jgi:hypothetical protein
MSSRRRKVPRPREVTEFVALDRETVEVFARRVVELLHAENNAGGLIDAAEVARLYGIARSTVYQKAAELGAIRLGDGPKARLRFDRQTVAERLSNGSGAKRVDQAEQAVVPRRRPTLPTRSRDVELLPIHARAAQGSRPSSTPSAGGPRSTHRGKKP